MQPADMKASVDAAQSFFRTSTSIFTESDSSFAPTPDMFTVAQQFAHVAQTIEWYLAGAFDEKGFDLDFAAHDRATRAVASISEARAMLDRAFQQARQAIEERSNAEWHTPLPAGPIMGGMPRYAVFAGMEDHTAHHRGALSVYSRLLGRVPPMPYGEG